MSATSNTDTASSQPLSEFDADTAVKRQASGQYQAEVTAAWNIMTVPNGGYLLSIVARALRDHLAHPDPFSVTGHFMLPVTPGMVSIEISTLKQGKAVSFAEAKLLQAGQEKIRVTAAFGEFSTRQGISHQAIAAPELPPFDDCVRGKIPLDFFRRVRLALTPESGAWLQGEHDDKCELVGWTSFIDGREADALSLLLFADGFPPPVFRKLGPKGWVPTVEMTVQVRAEPAPGPLRCRFQSRYIHDGYAEEDGEIWDSNGTLVALSRQLASIRLPK